MLLETSSAAHWLIGCRNAVVVVVTIMLLARCNFVPTTDSSPTRDERSVAHFGLRLKCTCSLMLHVVHVCACVLNIMRVKRTNTFSSISLVVAYWYKTIEEE